MREEELCLSLHFNQKREKILNYIALWIFYSMKQCKILAQVNHVQILLSCSWNAVKTSIEKQLKYFNRARYILVLCSEVYIMEWNSQIRAGLPVAIGCSLEFP